MAEERGYGVGLNISSDRRTIESYEIVKL